MFFWESWTMFFWPTLVLCVGVFVVPWLFAWKRGRLGAWISALVALVLLLLAPLLLLVVCMMSAVCGQGIILVVALVPVFLTAGVAVLISAVAAAWTWPRGARPAV